DRGRVFVTTEERHFDHGNLDSEVSHVMQVTTGTRTGRCEDGSLKG
ncbi:hypothetical protein A2U01_0089586, partial [Trifolium medium]|nr:hypothetical protein [Trifolium medium]